MLQRVKSKRGCLVTLIYVLVLLSCVCIALIIADTAVEKPVVVKSAEGQITVGDENIHFVTSNSYSQVEIFKIIKTSASATFRNSGLS